MLSAWPNWDLVFDFLTAPLSALVAAYQRLLVSYYITHDSVWGNDSSYSSVCPLLWTAEPSWLFAELKSIQWPLNLFRLFPSSAQIPCEVDLLMSFGFPLFDLFCIIEMCSGICIFFPFVMFGHFYSFMTWALCANRKQVCVRACVWWVFFFVLFCLFFF